MLFAILSLSLQLLHSVAAKRVFMLKDSVVDIGNDHFAVLINSEGQYSIWQAEKPIPEGWTQVGSAGSKEYCLSYIEKRWLDMKPTSLLSQLRQ